MRRAKHDLTCHYLNRACSKRTPCFNKAPFKLSVTLSPIMGWGPARFPGTVLLPFLDLFACFFPLFDCFTVLLCLLMRPWRILALTWSPRSFWFLLGLLTWLLWVLLGTLGTLLASFWSLLGLFRVLSEPLGARPGPLLQGNCSRVIFLSLLGHLFGPKSDTTNVFF